MLVQLGFEEVHGLEEGFLLAGGELVQDAGEWLGRAIEPMADCLDPIIYMLLLSKLFCFRNKT